MTLASTTLGYHRLWIADMKKILIIGIALFICGCSDTTPLTQRQLICNGKVELETNVPTDMIRLYDHDDGLTFRMLDRNWNILGIYTPNRGEACSIKDVVDESTHTFDH